MKPMFTCIAKLYPAGYSFFIVFLCWLGTQATVLGLPLPTRANQAPVAVTASTALRGASPLSVTFTGSNSYDPDGDPITYLWDFGDGTSSSEANPVKVFTPTRGRQGVLVMSYSVKLTVYDNRGGVGTSQSLLVSLENPAPTVRISNPVNNAKYTLDKANTYTFAANVTDDTPSSLTYLWQVKLRHNGREQLVTTVSGANPVVDISPAGCGGEDYYYLIGVKVTDVGGLSAQDSVRIYLDCSSPNLTVTNLTANPLTSSVVRLNWTNPAISFDDVLVVGKAGSGFTEIPLDIVYTANPSFTGNGSDLYGGKVLYQGTGNSVVVTDLTVGQPYYFRVYTRKGRGWMGGLEISATPTNPTSVPTIDPNKCYRLVSRASGKVLGVEGSSQTDGALIRQRTDNNQAAQRWRLESVENGYYKISAGQSNKVMDVVYGSQENGAGIQQWTFNGNSSYNQQFALQQNSSGYFQLTSRNSGKALEVQNGNTDEGGSVVQNTPNGEATQQWSIEERTCPLSAILIDPAKCYRIQSRSSGLTLNVPGGASADGTTLRQNANTGQPWQKWRLKLVDGSFYSISALHNLKGIQVNSSSTANNALLEQWTYWGGTHQQWAIQRNTEGFYSFTNRNSSKAITVRNASTAEGGVISQQTPGLDQSQQWTLVETTCPTGARIAAVEPGVSFSLRPNPAREQVFIDLSPVTGQPVDLKVSDLMGRTLHQSRIETAPAEPHRLDTAQLPGGIYFIQITPDGQSPTTLRLLIQQ